MVAASEPPRTLSMTSRSSLEHVMSYLLTTAPCGVLWTSQRKATPLGSMAVPLSPLMMLSSLLVLRSVSTGIQVSSEQISSLGVVSSLVSLTDLSRHTRYGGRGEGEEEEREAG